MSFSILFRGPKFKNEVYKFLFGNFLTRYIFYVFKFKRYIQYTKDKDIDYTKLLCFYFKYSDIVHVLSWLQGPEKMKLRVSYFQTFRLRLESSISENLFL